MRGSWLRWEGERGKGKGGYFVEREVREWLVEMEQVVIDQGWGKAMEV